MFVTCLSFLSIMSKRILIFGNSGSGKSTLANTLSNKLWIPIYHLDLLFLDIDWNALSLEERMIVQDKILRQQQWCIEWNYVDCIEQRISAATHIIILQIPLLFCMLNVLKRYCKWLLKYNAVWVHKKFRASLNLHWFFIWIPSYYKNTYKKITHAIEQ